MFAFCQIRMIRIGLCKIRIRFVRHPPFRNMREPSRPKVHGARLDGLDPEVVGEHEREDGDALIVITPRDTPGYVGSRELSR